MLVQYSKGGAVVRIEPELLVIACDPRPLVGKIDYSYDELQIFAALENFTFFTTCLQVLPNKVQDRVVVLDAAICSKMEGLVHGYRNETAKQWGLPQANKQTSNLITVYQIVKAGSSPTKAELELKLRDFLSAPPKWFPFKPNNYKVVSVREQQPKGTSHPAINPLDSPYFDHFSASNLAGGLPWRWLGLQGRDRTLYVHASTCFESVLHCWSYIQLLLKTHAVKSLPQDKGALIVIIGAGVSGLLFAHELHKLRYTNVLLLEKSNRYGGKTLSLRVPDGSARPLTATTICELGTCYMSPAYDEMVQALAAFTVGNERFDCAPGAERGMVDGTDGVLSFKEYGLKLAKEWLVSKGLDGDPEQVKEALVLSAGRYVYIRGEIFGSSGGIMPKTQPKGNPYGIFTTSFEQFLDDYEMGVLKGFMLYAYEVQGYGALARIPAYYGLLWITPDIAWPFGKTAGVTAWKKGWEDVWEQMVSRLDLNVQLKVSDLSIVRNATEGAESPA
jgi:NAD(P)-binding Rossmann-like domain